jgi:hypothetical protein
MSVADNGTLCTVNCYIYVYLQSLHMLQAVALKSFVFLVHCHILLYYFLSQVYFTSFNAPSPVSNFVQISQDVVYRHVDRET